MALFLKRKEINKKPVTMLANVPCKTEGRRIKNKVSQMERDKSGREWHVIFETLRMEDC